MNRTHRFEVLRAHRLHGQFERFVHGALLRERRLFGHDARGPLGGKLLGLLVLHRAEGHRVSCAGRFEASHQRVVRRLGLLPGVLDHRRQFCPHSRDLPGVGVQQVLLLGVGDLQRGPQPRRLVGQLAQLPPGLVALTRQVVGVALPLVRGSVGLHQRARGLFALLPSALQGAAQRRALRLDGLKHPVARTQTILQVRAFATEPVHDFLRLVNRAVAPDMVGLEGQDLAVLTGQCLPQERQPSPAAVAVAGGLVELPLRAVQGLDLAAQLGVLGHELVAVPRKLLGRRMRSADLLLRDEGRVLVVCVERARVLVVQRHAALNLHNGPWPTARRWVQLLAAMSLTACLRSGHAWPRHDVPHARSERPLPRQPRLRPADGPCRAT